MRCVRCSVFLVGIAMLLLPGCGGHEHAKLAARVYVPQLLAAPAYKPFEIDISYDGGNDWHIARWVSYGGFNSPSGR